MKIFQVGNVAKMVRITTDNDRLIIQVPLNRIVYSINGTIVNFIITTNNRVITESFDNIKRENGVGFSSIQELTLYLTEISSEISGGGTGGGITEQQLESRVSQSESSLNNTISQVNNNLSNEIASTNNNLANKVDITKIETPVLSLSDLPTPVGGIIDLLPNLTYRFQGLVNIGENQIRVSTSNTLLGFNRIDDGIVFSGSTHPIIVNNNTVSIDTITIILTNNNAKFFQINNNGTNSVVFKKCIFNGAGSLGNVSGCYLFGLDSCIISPLLTGGVEITGEVNNITITNNTFLNSSSDVQILLNNVNSEAILISDNIFKTNGVGVDVDNVTFQEEQTGIITSNNFSGTGQFIRGIYDDNIYWILDSNPNVPNTSSSYSPNNYTTIKDDFIGGSTETGEVGLYNWTFSSGLIGNAPTAILGRPGVVRRATNNSNNQVSSIYLGATITQGTVALGDIRSFIWIIRLVNSDYQNYDFYCGLSSFWGANAPLNALLFNKTVSDTTWHIASTSNGLRTNIDTLVPVTTNFVKLEIINQGTSIRYRIDETAFDGEISNNVPLSNIVLNFGNSIIVRNSLSKQYEIDYFSAIIKTTNR